jgi:hypothetical protein
MALQVSLDHEGDEFRGKWSEFQETFGGPVRKLANNITVTIKRLETTISTLTEALCGPSDQI